MKKIICCLLFLFALCSLFSCGASDPANTAEVGEVFSPLFRFTVSEGQASDTRLFYLPESDGFLYLHPRKEGGLTGGFVSPARSISSEAMFNTDASISSVTVWENGRDRTYLLTDKEIFALLLKENGAHRTPLPEDLAPQSPVPFDKLSFINEKDGLLLIHPVDFKETFVLAQSARLPDFAELILPGENGKKLWYARKDGERYKGIAFFEYGSNLPLDSEDFPFDTFYPIGGSSVLFVRTLEEGKTLYLYRDLDSGLSRSLISETAFEGVVCDPAGTVLCGTTSAGEGGAVHVFDLEKGTKKGEYTIDYGTPAKSLAISSDAKTLLIAVGKGHDEILGTLDLNQF